MQRRPGRAVETGNLEGITHSARDEELERSRRQGARASRIGHLPGHRDRLGEPPAIPGLDHAQQDATARSTAPYARLTSGVASEDDVRWRTLLTGEDAPDFGQGAFSEAVGLPVRLGGKTVAILVAERQHDEEPWSPAALSILCQAARLRLELDLAWRRLKTLQGSTAVATSAPAAATPPSPSAPPAAASEASPTELATWADPTEVPRDPRREEARRYARLVATDIRLYNEEAVVLGRRERDLAARLREQLARGRDAFARRFPDLGPEGETLLEEAFVQVLAGGDASLLR